MFRDSDIGQIGYEYGKVKSFDDIVICYKKEQRFRDTINRCTRTHFGWDSFPFPYTLFILLLCYLFAHVAARESLTNISAVPAIHFPHGSQGLFDRLNENLLLLIYIFFAENPEIREATGKSYDKTYEDAADRMLGDLDLSVFRPGVDVRMLLEAAGTLICRRHPQSWTWMRFCNCHGQTPCMLLL